MKPIPFTIAVLIGLVIWFVIPVPAGVDPNAWHLLAIFVATIAGIIGKAMPIGALAMISIAVVAATQVTSDSPGGAIRDALSSFSNSLIWLIGVSILISRGILKTGLGQRIGYSFISLFGKRTIGIGYALSLAELTLAPVTPSNTARGGAVMHPVMRSIASSFDSRPEEGTEGRIGRYLALVNYHANPITSAMFITATAPNPLVVQLVADATNAQISLSWSTWALAMLLPGLAAILLMPLVIYFLSPPEIKRTPDAATFARERLQKLGPISRNEWIMLGVFLVLLLLWAGIPEMIVPALAFDSTTTAFIGLALLLLTGVLTWEDVITEKTAWDTIVWFSALVMMATFLNTMGLTTWFAEQIQAAVTASGMSTTMAMAVLIIVYLYAHYFFASTTAHISSLFAPFYMAGLGLGADPMLLALLMAATSSIMMTLTHYATGTSPVIFGSGYVTLPKWWTVGFVMSIVNMIVWVTVGLVWWNVLGLI
ncbi:MAG: DASS family sodium-coupled anion symporter [Caldilineaceae bacterium]|nr:DASS family sodium-coupled anion symporter [Caldilineaceae bacterium]